MAERYQMERGPVTCGEQREPSTASCTPPDEHQAEGRALAKRLKPLSEQVIVITGASSGNGLVTAREAVRRGAAVVLVARNGRALKEIARDLERAGGRVTICPIDIATEGSAERIAEVAAEASAASTPGSTTWR